ncbi:hypothetical protein [Oceanobacillus sp. FSL W7-1309]|uniref:hypothetical protein n=1 Tax=Oceanobacillus sp. FSL W7-1309 TaxID=2954539 RepID=UPI0030FAA5F3
MICPYCNRKPNEIPEYQQGAQENEMNPIEYVRMDEGTYHVQTDLFCCSDCYFSQGMPLNTELVQAFMRYRAKVVELSGWEVTP